MQFLFSIATDEKSHSSGQNFEGDRNAGGTITFTGPGGPWANETPLTPGTGAGGQLSG